jgi:tetratricopeptide (TPR) repeat protein
MNRVESAINNGRCIIAIGARALATAEVQAEMRRRPLPFIALGGEPVNPAVALSAAAVAPAVSEPGGMVVLIEPEAGADGKALSELARLIGAGQHKPRLTVAARSFNPFALPMAMRLLKFDHEKQRALDFVAGLPVPTLQAVATATQAAAAVVAEKKAQKKAGPRAPRPTLVGREDELAALKELIAAPGTPILVHGAPGSGRRWLIEGALEGTELKRLPDLSFYRGIGVDSFAAILAMAAREAGDPALHELLVGTTHPTPAALAEALLAAACSPALAGHVWVIDGLDSLLDRRDSSFYRSGRLELALRQLLLTETTVQFVFPASMNPVYYREGQAALRRRLPVAGLKGRELHELFEAWHAPEFPRDRFGPIQERIHGHPLAARTFAVCVSAQEEPDVDALLERKRFLAAESIDDLGPLSRQLKKLVEGLSPELLEALHAVAMPRVRLDAEGLQGLGVNRKVRLELLSLGVLDQTPGDDRRYSVHPLVRTLLDRRKVEDFGRMEEFGNWCLQRADSLKRSGSRVEAVALAIEGNRLLTEARRIRSRMPLPYPLLDADLENIRSLMRRRQPRLDIARTRVNELKKRARTNTELLLCHAELLGLEKAKAEDIEQAYVKLAEQAPTAEVFHTEASWHLSRNARGRAVAALERGVAAFPEDARLQRRLAGLYLSQKRREDAVATLQKAQELEPMMPDTYGMMGEISTELGPEHWEQAESYLAEALRLAPNHPVHLTRKAGLLRLQALTDAERREVLLEEAEALLRQAIVEEKNNRRAQTMLATVLIDKDGDLDQARWLLKQVMRKGRGGRRREHPDALVQRARLLVRDEAWDEAEALIARAIKGEPSFHAAFAVRGELHHRKGDLIPAFEAYKSARERSPREAPERALYEAALSTLTSEIEAAAARAAEAAAEAGATEPAPAAPATSRAGATVLRKTAAEEAAAPSPDEAPTADAAPAAAEEEPSEPTADTVPTETAAPAEAEAPAAPAEAETSDGELATDGDDTTGADA